jgi:hypothetical protein
MNQMSRSLGAQKRYVEVFGELQSGGSDRPLEGRILLDVDFTEGSAEINTAASGQIAPVCKLLVDTDIQAVEILGLSAGGPEPLAQDRAESFMAALNEACGEIDMDLVTAGEGDALPLDGDTDSDATLIELRVIE